MTALVLLTHQPAVMVNRMVDYWKEKTSPGHLMVAYGGAPSEMEKISAKKVFIDDPRLRTRDHQRERQSYTQVLQRTVAAMDDVPWDNLYFAEYDVLPVAANLWELFKARADHEEADLLAHRVWRIDDTLHPHLSSHRSTPEWSQWISQLSVREDKLVVLSCMGCGQWWRRPALESVLSKGEPVPAYLELQLPTVAHHLGYRVRGMEAQDRFITTEPLSKQQCLQMVDNSPWVIHPYKQLWDAETW